MKITQDLLEKIRKIRLCDKCGISIPSDVDRKGQCIYVILDKTTEFDDLIIQVEFRKTRYCKRCLESIESKMKEHFNNYFCWKMPKNLQE